MRSEPWADHFVMLNKLIRAFCSALAALTCIAAAYGASALEGDLSIETIQREQDTATVTATNLSRKTMFYEVKIYYSYESLSGGRLTGCKTLYGSLEPSQVDQSAGFVTVPKLQIEKILILSVSTS